MGGMNFGGSIVVAFGGNAGPMNAVVGFGATGNVGGGVTGGAGLTALTARAAAGDSTAT